jgi:hypothetical protein
MLLDRPFGPIEPTETAITAPMMPIAAPGLERLGT